MSDSPNFSVGFSRTIVTPPLGTFLIGYGDRTTGCDSVHDDLTATCLLFDDGDTQMVLVAVDILALNEHIVSRVRQRVSSRWGIAPSGVMVCCSHTHSGPIAYADETSEPKNRQYIDGLISKLVGLVVEAKSTAAPASLHWGQGEAHIAVNRRQQLPDGTVILGVNPGGPADPSLKVLQIRFHGGTSTTPPVTLVNYACHPTILGPNNNVVSAEWPGVMCREVERSTGGPCLFLQGAAGDLNPNHEWDEKNLLVMQQFGQNVAEQVLQTVASGMEPVPITILDCTSCQSILPILLQTNTDGDPKTYGQALATLVGIPEEEIDAILDERFPWKVTFFQEDGRWYVPMEIQVFRIGGLALVAHAAEPFNEIGALIKEISPAPVTLFAGYSNGCVGYLPTAEAHALGGYEVEAAPYFYRLPGLLDPSCAELVVDETLAGLRKLFPERAV